MELNNLNNLEDIQEAMQEVFADNKLKIDIFNISLEFTKAKGIHFKFNVKIQPKESDLFVSLLEIHKRYEVHNVATILNSNVITTTSPFEAKDYEAFTKSVNEIYKKIEAIDLSRNFFVEVQNG